MRWAETPAFFVTLKAGYNVMATKPTKQLESRISFLIATDLAAIGYELIRVQITGGGI